MNSQRHPPVGILTAVKACSMMVCSSSCRLLAPDAGADGDAGEDDTQRSAAAPILEIAERFVREGAGESAPQVTDRRFFVKEGRIEVRRNPLEEGLESEVDVYVTAPPKAGKVCASCVC